MMLAVHPAVGVAGVAEDPANHVQDASRFSIFASLAAKSGVG
jgi:hypothetical protein